MHDNPIKNLECPSCENDAVNKKYVDNLLSNFRTGTVHVGDVSNRNDNLSYTGAITGSTISTAYGSGDCFVTFTFSDRNYTPVVLITP